MFGSSSSPKGRMLTFSEPSKVYSVASDTARTFLYELMSEWSTDTIVGYLSASEIAAMVLIPVRKPSMSVETAKNAAA